MCNRVTSAMLAIMLGTLNRGDSVISLVGKGRSHPSVQQAVELVGADFIEVESIEALEDALPLRSWKMLVVTPLTPSKHHVPADQVARAIRLAKERDMLVFLDDAHMMSRTIFFDEPPTFHLGDVDLSVWSLDKHVPGPRGAAIVGHNDLMEQVSAQAFQFGLEAQSGHYVAMLRGMEAFDPEPVKRASALARTLYTKFRARFGPTVYQAGPGVALTAEDFTEVVFNQAGTRETTLAPSEVSVTASFLLLTELRRHHHPHHRLPRRSPHFPTHDAPRRRTLRRRPPRPRRPRHHRKDLRPPGQPQRRLLPPPRLTPPANPPISMSRVGAGFKPAHFFTCRRALILRLSKGPLIPSPVLGEG